jgi:hypothetical protein
MLPNERLKESDGVKETRRNCLDCCGTILSVDIP